jgi:hypothetical protein
LNANSINPALKYNVIGMYFACIVMSEYDAKPTVTVRLSPEEFNLLEDYCQQNLQSKTEVIRWLIRGLKKRIK